MKYLIGAAAAICSLVVIILVGAAAVDGGTQEWDGGDFLP